MCGSAEDMGSGPALPRGRLTQGELLPPEADTISALNNITTIEAVCTEDINFL